MPRIAFLFVMTCCLCFTGCLGIDSDRTYTDKPTLGQELVDLKAALETGAIDEHEFKRLKAQIIRQSK